MDLTRQLCKWHLLPRNSSPNKGLQDAGSIRQGRTLVPTRVAVKEHALGPNHSDIALGLNNQADLYKATGRADGAAALEQRAKAIRDMKR